MNIDQLKYLVDLVQTNSINATAKRMFITQQSLSESIKRLESELGCTLINRSKTGVDFTEDGRVILEYAQQILKPYQHMQQYLQQKYNQDYLQGNLLIGVAPLTATTILPHMLLKMNQLYPDITLYVQEHTSTAIIKALLNQELDFGLFAYSEDNSPETIDTITHSLDSINMTPLYSDKMVCVMAKHCPLYKQEALSLEKIYQHNKTSYPGSNLISEQEKFFHVSSNALIHQQFMLVKETTCCMPYQAYLAHYPQKQFGFRPITDAKPIINYLAYRKPEDDSFTAIQKLFVENISILLPEQFNTHI